MAKVLTIPRSGLIAEYLLDNNATDTQDGSKTNATETNVTYANTDVWYQNKYWVFGATSTLTRASLSSAQCISFWMYPTANNKTIFTAVTTTGLLTISSGDVLAFSWASNVTFYVNWQQSTAATLNTWQHVLVTFDSYTLSNFNFGSSSYTGNLQSIRVYNRKPDSNEIYSLYLEGKKLLWGKSFNSLLSSQVAYWDFNGDAQDIVAWYNWTVTWATITTDRLWNSGGYIFAWSTDKIRVSNSTSILWTSDYTISFWAKITSNPTSGNIKWLIALASTWTSAALHTQIDYHNNSGTLGVRVLVANSAWTYPINIRSDADLSSAGWNMFTFTLSGTTWTLYKNGASASTGTFSWTRVSDNTTGKYFWTDCVATAWVNLVWSLDEIHFFTRALSASEVLAMYNVESRTYLYQWN